MKLSPTSIPDVKLVTSDVFRDERGFFFETWRASSFVDAGIPDLFVQDALSRSELGVLRGLHYQIQNPQGKLVRAVVGEIFDVAVDLRRNSPTFGAWVGQTLSADNNAALWIPPGFAHGFYVTGEEAEVAYKLTAYRSPEHERFLRWDDPAIGIDWPIRVDRLVISERDRAASSLSDAECYDA